MKKCCPHCVLTLPSNCINYIGGDLANIGVERGDSLTQVLQNINSNVSNSGGNPEFDEIETVQGTIGGETICRNVIKFNISDLTDETIGGLNHKVLTHNFDVKNFIDYKLIGTNVSRIGTLTFTKPNGADWTLPVNQDQITGNVHLTRQNQQQLFNILNETAADGNGGVTPTDTEWALGSISDGVGSLTFDTMSATLPQIGNQIVNNPMVLHLITDNIYLDINFTFWGQGGSGGGFSYERDTINELNFDFLVDEPSINSVGTNNNFSIYNSTQTGNAAFDSNQLKMLDFKNGDLKFPSSGEFVFIAYYTKN